MHVESLVCVGCGKSYGTDQVRYECECGASLDVQYDYDAVADSISWSALRDRSFTHHRYRELLPAVDDAHRIRLGGGGTPLIRSDTIGPELGIDLRFKLESLNPSGSFKDRGTAVELGKAMDTGADEIVVASTGNMGASIATYAARVGVEANIYVPQDVQGTQLPEDAASQEHAAGVPSPKLDQMERHGAHLIRVDGDYSEAAEQAWTAYKHSDAYLMGDYPYRGEGEKTVGHEIADRMEHDDMSVDTVAVPVGNGTLIHAVWKGLSEMQRIGLTAGTPRMLGVQADGCNTVVGALQKGFDSVEPVEDVETVAGAIACGDPLDGDHAMNAIRDSDGFGAAASDDAILDAKQRLAKEEGIYAEEAGATALAGILAEADRFDGGETVVCLVTGHGLKT